jgi:hypothetical protein
MGEDRRRKRMGLEGLPVTSGDVYGFGEIRLFMRNSGDGGALACVWVALIALIVVAIWGSSLGLGALSVLLFAVAMWWTISKWRSWSAARRQMRRARARDQNGTEGS